MSTCRVCGEQGHLAAVCDELYCPPDTIYTGPGCGADEDDHDHDMLTLIDETMQNEQDNSQDDAILSKPPMQTFAPYMFPSKLSNGVV